MHTDALGAGPGGNISLRAATLTLNDATVHADTLRSGKAGDIAVAITGAAALDGSAGSVPASISSTSLDGSSGPPGNITIASGALSLGGGALISSCSLGASNTGLVRVDTGNLTMAGMSQISSDTVGSGAAGSVSVNTGSLFMTDQLTQISSSTTAGGPAGRVSVTADSATISNVAQISALTTGSGNGGTVQVAIAGELKIVGPPQDNIFITGISSVADPGSTGKGGSIFVSTGRLSISGFSAEISSSTLGSGRAGDVTVQVAGPLSITGPVGQFPTGIVAATLQPSFADSPRVTGDAGNVSVSAQSISLTGGGSIATLTSGVGAGGSVGVSTPGNLLLDSGGQIAASATDPNSASAGQVTVLAGRLAIGGGAQIASTTAGKGIGGDISVASPLIDLIGPGPQITARSTGSGDAGSIRLAARRLNLRGGASISTEAATANGGNISLTVVGLSLSEEFADHDVGQGLDRQWRQHHDRPQTAGARPQPDHRPGGAGARRQHHDRRRPVRAVGRQPRLGELPARHLGHGRADRAARRSERQPGRAVERAAATRRRYCATAAPRGAAGRVRASSSADAAGCRKTPRRRSRRSI